jgi:hypothetical protein
MDRFTDDAFGQQHFYVSAALVPVFSHTVQPFGVYSTCNYHMGHAELRQPLRVFRRCRLSSAAAKAADQPLRQNRSRRQSDVGAPGSPSANRPILSFVCRVDRTRWPVCDIHRFAVPRFSFTDHNRLDPAEDRGARAGSGLNPPLHLVHTVQNEPAGSLP